MRISDWSSDVCSSDLLAQLDAKLVALNRADGTVAWEQTIDDWKNGVTTNSAPLVVGDHVIVGISGGEYGVRGYLKSYNAKTRSEERRGGKECVRTGRSRWSPYH